MLPYVEQISAFDQGVKDGVMNNADASGVPVQTFLCPDDPTGANNTGRPPASTATWGGIYTGADKYGASCYAANYLVFGAPNAADSASRARGHGAMDETFRDGTSNTVMFTERYAVCANPVLLPAGYMPSCLWGDGMEWFRPSFCVNTIDNLATSNPPPPVPTNYPEFGANWTCLTPQERPDWTTTCDPSRAQSAHPGAINACMGDGSVRSVSYNVNTLAWWRACNPQDGQLLGDW